ncbi:MAG: SDR family NAD(P)-dependent oxidoreductase [Candidatus Eremiobacteraeota bacterium]|nr:SDR family NAD(P)-dependent oxidoreductase [Candidatus Eremiobacteraeota bacterium]
MPDEARTLIVTGASSGIGRALALESIRAGYRAVLVARRKELLEQIARSIHDAGGTCITIAGDVTAPPMATQIVDAAMANFGRIDVVINNAGGGAYGELLAQSDAAIAAQWQLHVAAPLRIARAALAHLIATRGQLVFIGSGVARVPLPHNGAYGLAKAAIRSAAIQLRRELRSRGVGVTYVDPGVVATEFHSSLQIERPPSGAVAPERVARAILAGIRRRRAVINAVRWQTALATFGEWSGTLADPLIIRGFTVRRTEGQRQPAPVEERVILSLSKDEPVEGRFEAALEPVARRMERVKLTSSFLREALVPDTTLELGPLAMRWAGMPNKNERAALREALDALTEGGYLEPAGEETWRVLRAAD